MPSPSPLAGAENTAIDRASTSVPPHRPIVEQAKGTKITMLGLKQVVPDPQSHPYDPVLVVPPVKTSTQAGLGSQEISSEFRPGSSASGKATSTVNKNIPKLPFQTIVSVRTIMSSDPAPESTSTSQDSNFFNGISTVTGSEPSLPLAHLPATVVASHDRPQGTIRTDRDQKPHPPQIAGVDVPNTLRTAEDPVPTVDYATYQYHIDHVSNLVFASETAQAGDSVTSVASLQTGRPVSANDIAVGNKVSVEASALVAATVPPTVGSSTLENIGFTLPIPSIEISNVKTYPITSQATRAAAIPAVDVLNILSTGTLDIITIDGKQTITATPGHLTIARKPGAAGLSEWTKSSESLKMEAYGTRDLSTLDPPPGKVGSTHTSDHSMIGSPTGILGSISTDIQILEETYDKGDPSTFDSPTSQGGSTSTGIQILEATSGTGDHSIYNSPTIQVGSTSTGTQNLEGTYDNWEYSTSRSPTGNVGNVGSTSTAIQILEGTSGNWDHSTSNSPTGNVGSTSTGKQVLEGRAWTWKSRVEWKKAGLTGLLIGILL